MHRSLVALLALVPAAAALTFGPEADARDSFPEGEVVFRPECFNSYVDEDLAMAVPTSAPGGGLARSGSGKGGGGAKPKPKAPAPMQPSAPPPPPMPAPMDSSADVGGAPMPMEMEESAPVINFGRDKPIDGADSSRRAAEKKVAQAEEAARKSQEEATRAEAAAASARKAAEKAAKEAEKARETASSGDAELDDRSVAQRVMDWGAKIYLSNDDSMSLAAAQRLLYAVKNDVWFGPDQVRPHELLNYFSFDTVTPDADQTFDVLASAEQHGDSLAVALAVKGSTPERQPLDLTAIVDVSGSMNAEGRMDYTKRGLHLMADQLKSGDRVDIVMFDDGKCVPLENYVEGRDDPSLLTRTIDGLQPDGGTNLDMGLREGYRVAKAHRGTNGRNRRVMLLSDAMMNLGDVDENTVSEIGKSFEGDGIRLTGVGVGRDFNDKVLDMLTEKGKGAYVYLGSEAVVDRIFGVGFPSLTQTIAHDVQFELQLPDSLAMERFYGEEASTNAADVQPINYYAGTSQVFLQDLTIKKGDPVRNDPVVFTVRYTDALTGEPEQRVFKTTVGAMLDADKHNVRKARALMAFSDVLMAKSMHMGECNEPLSAYAQRAALLPDDAEVGYVNGLLTHMCGDFELPSVVSSKTVAYKVKVDADIPIAEVALSCSGSRWSSPLSGSTTVARFDATPGACELTLSGQVDMTAAVDVPETGGDVRCVVRGGRLACM